MYIVPSTFVQLFYNGNDRGHVTKCIEMYSMHVILLSRAHAQSLDYLSASPTPL